MKGLIIKILLLSTTVSYGVKYGGRYFPIEPNNINALIAIITPSFVLGILLFLRGKNSVS